MTHPEQKELVAHGEREVLKNIYLHFIFLNSNALLLQKATFM